jgi:hypothetical protein
VSSHADEIITIASGTGATWSAGIIAFSVALTPVLHAIAILVTIGVGVLTGWWTIMKIREMHVKADAVVAAAVVKARAVVVATALDESKDG